MSYIQYSPWNDAAAVGQGIGSSIAKVLLELPMERRRMEREDQRMELDRRRLDVMEQMNTQKAGYYDTRGDVMLEDARRKDRQQKLDTVDKSMGRLIQMINAQSGQTRATTGVERAQTYAQSVGSRVENDKVSRLGNMVRALQGIAETSLVKPKFDESVRHNKAMEGTSADRTAIGRDNLRLRQAEQETLSKGLGMEMPPVQLESLRNVDGLPIITNPTPEIMQQARWKVIHVPTGKIFYTNTSPEMLSAEYQEVK